MTNSIEELKDLIVALDKKVDLGFMKLEPTILKVERHERILVRQNGTPALVDKVEDMSEKLDAIERAEHERSDLYKAYTAERRKFYYALGATFFGVMLDLFLRVTGIM
ncbi:MAG TPA: hypothetical protein PKD55_21810 [Bellilinea sp.]|nr:hypothetical protein [Bellilinea sp.]